MGRASSELYLLGGLDGVQESGHRGLDDVGENLAWGYGDEGGDETGPLCDHGRKKEDIFILFFLVKNESKGVGIFQRGKT